MAGWRDSRHAARCPETSHYPLRFRVADELAQDLRYTFRGMRRSVGFTSVAVLSLAVGIGAVTSAFAVIDAVMLRGLPVRDPERLVAFSSSGSPAWGSWPYAAFLRWRDSPDARFEVAASSDVRSHDVPLRGSEKPVEVRVSLVSANYFRVMGADVAPGRSLVDADAAAPGTAPVAVISDAFWDRWFGRAPDVLAKTIELQGVSYEVVGVARKGFTGHSVGHPSDVWIPLTMQPALMPGPQGLLEDRWGTGGRWLRIIGRLGDGVNIEEATASAALVRQRFIADKAAELGDSSPEVARDRREVVSLLRATTGYAPERARYGRPLMILSGITALVLLVACANFTNLMLARSERRLREFVIRLALGGGRWRLIRQLATECVLLAVVAGLLGLLLASWATTVTLKQFAVMIEPVEFALDLDGRVLGFAGACVAVVMAFGLWPCTRPARSAEMSSVYQATHAGGRTRSRVLAGRIMLVVQLAACTVLLIGAGLLLRTVNNLRSQDLGFDRNVLLVSVSPGQGGYVDQAAAMLLQRVRERLLAVSGIHAVGISGPGLLDYTNYWIDRTKALTTDQGVVVPDARWTSADVGPGFFEAVGMSLVAGRTFEERDADPPADAVVINQSLARFLFANERPLGRRFRLNPRSPMKSVIGVVNDAKQTSPRDRAMGVVYLPMRGFNRVVLAVRTADDPSGAVDVVRHQLGSIAADLPIDKIRTISEVLDTAIAQERLMSAISLVLAVMVIAIGCVGLYALLSYDVEQRTHELGIRLALGATSTNVVNLVLRGSAALVLPGLAIGVPLGIAASRPLAPQLYGVQPGDPWTVASVAVVVAMVAVVATLRPAQRASRVDPIALLRSE